MKKISLLILITFLMVIKINILFSMEYVTISDKDGKTCNFSRLIMGTDHLLQENWGVNGNKQKSDEEFFKILDDAVSKGINVFDTSPIYVGSVEYRLGKWIESRKELIKSDEFYIDKSLNPDRKIYIITKGGFPFDLYYSKKLPYGTHSKELILELKKKNIMDKVHEKFNNVPAGTYASRLFGSEDQILERVSEEVSTSNRNLHKNISIYLFHRDDGDFINFNNVKRDQTPVKRILNVVTHGDLKRNYWSFGFSNWTNERMDEVTKLLDNGNGLNYPIFNSPYFSLFEMGKKTIHAGGYQVTHKDMMDPNFQKGVYMMTYSPLGGFSIFDRVCGMAKKDSYEKYKKGDAYWRNVFHSVFTKENGERCFRVLKFMERFNKTHNTEYTMDQFFNAYVLAHKRADFVTIGPLNIEQLNRTIESMALSKKLTLSDIEFLYSGKR